MSEDPIKPGAAVSFELAIWKLGQAPGVIDQPATVISVCGKAVEVIYQHRGEDKRVVLHRNRLRIRAGSRA